MSIEGQEDTVPSVAVPENQRSTSPRDTDPPAFRRDARRLSKRPGTMQHNAEMREVMDNIIKERAAEYVDEIAKKLDEFV